MDIFSAGFKSSIFWPQLKKSSHQCFSLSYLLHSQVLQNIKSEDREKTRQRCFLTTKIMPQTASHLRKLDAGFHSNLTQLYGVNWKTILFILPLKGKQSTLL